MCGIDSHRWPSTDEKKYILLCVCVYIIVPVRGIESIAVLCVCVLMCVVVVCVFSRVIGSLLSRLTFRSSSSSSSNHIFLPRFLCSVNFSFSHSSTSFEMLLLFHVSLHTTTTLCKRWNPNPSTIYIYIASLLSMIISCLFVQRVLHSLARTHTHIHAR